MNQKLKNKIIEAVPSIKKYGRVSDGGFIGRPITLCDVLLTINKLIMEDKRDFDCLTLVQPAIKNCITLKDEEDNTELWDLTKDLDNQSKECLTFLEDILLNER